MTRMPLQTLYMNSCRFSILSCSQYSNVNENESTFSTVYEKNQLSTDSYDFSNSDFINNEEKNW